MHASEPQHVASTHFAGKLFVTGDPNDTVAILVNLTSTEFMDVSLKTWNQAYQTLNLPVIHDLTYLGNLEAQVNVSLMISDTVESEHLSGYLYPTCIPSSSMTDVARTTIEAFASSMEASKEHRGFTLEQEVEPTEPLNPETDEKDTNKDNEGNEPTGDNEKKEQTQVPPEVPGQPEPQILA